MNPKPWWRSKTIRFQVGTAVVGILTALSESELLQDNPQAVGFILLSLAIVNSVLRATTKEPIAIL